MDSPNETIEEVEKNGVKAWTLRRGIDISSYQESVGWDLMSIVGTKHVKWYPQVVDYPFVDITYYITLRRKTLFFTINLIIPCVGIGFLASLVFYLPCESHNKITLSVSVTVSFKVFVLLLIEIMPPTSLTIPLIGQYLLFTLIMVACSVTVTVVILNIHYQPDYLEIPWWLRKIFIEFLPRFIFLEKKGLRFKFKNRPNLQNTTTVRLQKQINFCDPMNSESCVQDADKQVLATYANISYIAHRLKIKAEKQNNKDEWKFLANVIDRIFLITFTWTIFLGICFIMLSAPVLRGPSPNYVTLT